jgi:hypothetical protein
MFYVRKKFAREVLSRHRKRIRIRKALISNSGSRSVQNCFVSGILKKSVLFSHKFTHTKIRIRKPCFTASKNLESPLSTTEILAIPVSEPESG